MCSLTHEHIYGDTSTQGLKEAVRAKESQTCVEFEFVLKPRAAAPVYAKPQEPSRLHLHTQRVTADCACVCVRMCMCASVCVCVCACVRI
jgi:hypothetical protein